MATTRPQSELATAVMEHLGLTNAGEAPAASDASFVLRRYTNLMDELRDEQIAYWDNNAIPYEAFEGVVSAVGILVMGAFGLDAPVGRELEDAMEVAKRRIRRRVVKPASGEPAAADDSYF